MEAVHFEDPKGLLTSKQSANVQWHGEAWDHKDLPGLQQAGVGGL